MAVIILKKCSFFGHVLLDIDLSVCIVVLVVASRSQVPLIIVIWFQYGSGLRKD